jgi:HPt (histidine-containing phosphotransfer) domain-containing protein
VHPQNPSSMTDSQVIDPEALERLKEWGGDKLAGQMVRLFLKNSGTRMDQIRTGVGEGDREEVERGAHSLKSSAANIGAENLRTLSTQIESAALEEDVARMSALLPEMESAYGLAMSELKLLEEGMPDES